MNASEVIKQQYSEWQANAIKFLNIMLKSANVKSLTFAGRIIYQEPHLIAVGLNEEGVIIENTYQYDNQFTVALTELKPEDLIWVIDEVENKRYKIDEDAK